jgi:hypothetical protein
MSKQNKVNKSNYDQGGRLTPDDMARERKRQAEVSSHTKGGERMTAKAAQAPRGKATARQERGQDASRPRSAPEE